MAEFSRSIMKNYSLQDVLIVRCLPDSFLEIERIRINIQVIRKFPSGVYLLILEFVVIEAHSLEMDNEKVGDLSQQSALGYISLLFTCVALVI